VISHQSSVNGEAVGGAAVMCGDVAEVNFGTKEIREKSGSLGTASPTDPEFQRQCERFGRALERFVEVVRL
jgi:hypothetical protein